MIVLPSVTKPTGLRPVLFSFTFPELASNARLPPRKKKNRLSAVSLLSCEVPSRLPSARLTPCPASPVPFAIAQAPPVICRLRGLKPSDRAKPAVLRPAGFIWSSVDRKQARFDYEPNQKTAFRRFFCARSAFARPPAYNFRTILC